MFDFSLLPLFRNILIRAVISVQPASKFSEEGKDSLQQRLWNLNIYIGKVDVKCSLAEMT